MTKRKLPSNRNPLLAATHTPPYANLIERRKLGQTNLSVKGDSPSSIAVKDGNALFDYVHLKVPLPRDLEKSEIFTPTARGQYPEAYYLMRRSSDGFISATGMFKAAFPYASTANQELEKDHHKSFPTGDGEEIAGNVWIAPDDALTLADEYGIRAWILALLDDSPITASDKNKSTSRISTPPAFKMSLSDKDKLTPHPDLAAPTPKSRSKRSVSPGKISASPRKIASPRKRRGASAKPEEKTGEKSSEEPAKSLRKASEEPTKSLRKASEEPTKSARKTSKALQEKLTNGASAEPAAPAAHSDVAETVKVEVNETVERIDDKEITHTTVTVAMPASHPDLPLPEDTTGMIEKAREMVEEANKIDKRTTKGSKRKASSSLTKADTEGEELAVKKPRTELQEKLVTERVRTRALLGLTATLVVGAIIPYFV